MQKNPCEIPRSNGINILQKAQQTRNGPNMLPCAGSTVRKLLKAEYAQADVLSRTCARAGKTQADSSNNVSAALLHWPACFN